MRYKILSIVLLFSSCLVKSQINTAYSELGLGNRNQVGLISNFMLGGLTATYRSENYANPSNPASLSEIRYTIAETGVLFAANQQPNGSVNGFNTAFNTGFNLSAATLAFPLNQNAGFAVGLLPYSEMKYSYSTTENIFDDVTASRVFDGEGTISDAFMAFGYAIKGFSFGAKGSFLFGNLIKTNRISFDSGEFLNIRRKDFNRVRGANLDIGFQYEITTGNNDNYIRFGANSNVSDYVNIAQYSIINDFTIRPSTNEFGDLVELEDHNQNELVNTSDNPNNEIVPLSTSIQAGVEIGKKNSYLLGIQYNNDLMKDFSFNNSSNILANGQRIIAGAEWIPNINATGYGGFWKSIKYRFGGHLGEAPFRVNDEQVNEYGMNFGFSIPLSKMRYESDRFGSYINLGFGYNHRGGVQGVPTDDIYMFNFGIVLNDKWFIQRKFK